MSTNSTDGRADFTAQEQALIDARLRRPASPNVGRPAAPALTLYEALQACEAGRNEHGPYWRTAPMVEALRVFYAQMETLMSDD